MINNYEAAPRRLAIPGTDALLAIAHPDDEFMVGGAIDALVANGVTVHALIATNGEASDRGDPNFVQSGQRWREGSKALSAYGIDREHQHFIGLPDAGLSDDEPFLVLTARMGSLLVAHNILTVITSGEEGGDGHSDHIQVHRAAEQSVRVHSASRPSVRLYGLTRSNPDTLVPADATAKIRRLGHHVSQFTIDTKYADPNNLDEVTRLHLHPYWLNLYAEGYRIRDYQQSADIETAPIRELVTV